jgi:uncharacterized membrane protein
MQKHFFSFTKKNYLIILAGVALVIIGFLLMVGGGSSDPKVFNGEELFSTRRITIAPLSVIAGYVVVIFGIMYKTETETGKSKVKPGRGGDVIDGKE